MMDHPEKLEIAMLDGERDIDASLEEMSEKIKLTATNVRSIIHVSICILCNGNQRAQYHTC